MTSGSGGCHTDQEDAQATCVPQVSIPHYVHQSRKELKTPQGGQLWDGPDADLPPAVQVDTTTVLFLTACSAAAPGVGVAGETQMGAARDDQGVVEWGCGA